MRGRGRGRGRGRLLQAGAPEDGRSPAKRAAIAQAALRLFVRDGYARTSVDAIAAEAGVSKRTIYNHYGDKENLFLSVVRDTYDSMIASFQRIMNAHLTQVGDVERDLTAFLREAAFTLLKTPERSALVRLVMTEAPHFPELRRQHLQPLTITQVLAGRLAALAADDLLDIDDPQEAAGQLFALTFGQANNRSMFGAFPLTDAEIDRFVTGGVGAFLRAYRPAPARWPSSPRFRPAPSRSRHGAAWTARASGGGAVEVLQQVMGGELDRFVPPLGLSWAKSVHT